MTKYNFTSVFALIIYPIFLIALSLNYVFDYQFGLFEGLLFVCGYYVANITVGIGLHRLWSHDSYKINKYVEFVLVILSAGTLQGPALSWASNHFKHHTHTDTDLDPHSPLKYQSKVRGFWWSHMGWMLEGEGSWKSITKVTMVKLGRNKLLRWQLKYYWELAIIMNLFVPAIVGFAIGNSLQSAYAGFLFIGLGRALQQQITFFVNSLCHFAGTKKYVKSTSGDIWWLALLLLGENYHNYHHAFPSDYRNGAKWYHFDAHKWIIYLMSLCGLAWDLNRTPKIRIEAKMSQTIEQYASLRREKLELMNIKIAELALIMQDGLKEVENTNLRKRFSYSLSKLQINLNKLTHRLNNQLKNLENSSENIVNIISKEIKKIENSWQKIYLELESQKLLVQ